MTQEKLDSLSSYFEDHRVPASDETE